MSDTSQGPDWWRASDGKWYPPRSGAVGWYADPQGLPCYRFWDGGRWTEKTDPYPHGSVRASSPKKEGFTAGLTASVIVGIVLIILAFFGGFAQQRVVVNGQIVSCGDFYNPRGPAGVCPSTHNILGGFAVLLAAAIACIVVPFIVARKRRRVEFAAIDPPASDPIVPPGAARANGDTFVPGTTKPLSNVAVVASEKQQLAGWWQRAGGWVLDGLIVGIPFLIVDIAVGILVYSRATAVVFPTAHSAAGSGVRVTLDLAADIAQVAYAVWFLGSRGQTIGMKILGIVAVDRRSGGPLKFAQAWKRALTVIALTTLWFQIGFITSLGHPGSSHSGLAAVGFIGAFLTYLWPLGSTQNQTLQDKAAASLVVAHRPNLGSDSVP